MIGQGGKMKKTFQYHSSDNVVIALEKIESGDTLRINGEPAAYTAKDALPMGHKIANCDIAEGAAIIKFGHAIGTASRDIPRGGYVHTHNVKDLIANWTEVPEAVYDANAITEIEDCFLLNEKPQLTGYRRKNGMAGFRNHLLVVSTTVCANQIVQDIGYLHRDVIAITNPSGCVILPNEVERIRSILLSMARNPNVGAVVFVGLGCESVDAEWFCHQVKDEKPAAFVREQTEGSSPAAYEKLKAIVADMKNILSKQQRESVSFADIRLGSKCGGSDWTTAVVSNPAIGYVSDMVVKNGGISMIGETCGWFGGESILVKQARTSETAEKIRALLADIDRRAKAMGYCIEEGNPTPGNMAGGITTLCEKALGNVKKGGTAPVEGVLAFGESPQSKGFYVLDNPGLDPVSLLGLTCSSANIILFSTGRGTPTGTPLAPAIKLTGSPDAVAVFSAHMDADISPMVSGEMSLDEAGRLLFGELIAVANGKLTISEQFGHREYAFPLLMGAL